MRKSFWLLSAGLFALSTPAFAQETDTDGTDASRPTRHRRGRRGRQPQRPAAPSRRSTAAISSSPRRAAAKRSRTCRSRSPRSPPKRCRIQRRDRHPPAEPARAVAARLLDRHRSQRLGAVSAASARSATIPASKARSRCSSTASIARASGIGLNELGEIERIEVLRGPQGTLFGRNASAGLIHDHHREADVQTSAAMARSTIGNYDLRRVAVGAHRPDHRHARGPPRRRLRQARRLPRRTSITGDRRQRPRPLLRCAARCCSSRTTRSRVRLIGDYSKRDETLLRRGLSRPTRSTTRHRRARATAAAPSNASSTSCAASAQTSPPPAIPSTATSRSRRAAPIDGDDQGLGPVGRGRSMTSAAPS